MFVDYSDNNPMGGDGFSLFPAGVFTSSSLVLSRSYLTSGAFALVSSLMCDNTTISLQQIITVTDGKVFGFVYLNSDFIFDIEWVSLIKCG